MEGDWVTRGEPEDGWVLNATQERHPGRETVLLTDDERIEEAAGETQDGTPPGEEVPPGGEGQEADPAPGD